MMPWNTSMHLPFLFICILMSQLAGTLHAADKTTTALTAASHVYPAAVLPLACSHPSAPVYLEMAYPAGLAQLNACPTLIPLATLAQTSGDTSAGSVGNNLKFVMLDREVITLTVDFDKSAGEERATNSSLLNRAVKSIFIVDEGASPLLNYGGRKMNLKLTIVKDEEAKKPLTKEFTFGEIEFNGTFAEICLDDLNTKINTAFHYTLFKSDGIKKLYLKAKVELPEVKTKFIKPEMDTYYPLAKLPVKRSVDVQNVITLQISEKQPPKAEKE